MTSDGKSWEKAALGLATLNEGLLELRSQGGVERIRHELVGGDRHTALSLLPYLLDSEIESLLPELVFLASFSHGAIERVRSTIRRLPKQLLKGSLPAMCEKHLAGEEEYRRFLELFAAIDDELCASLAERARASSDAEIRAIGEEFRRA